MTPSTQFKLGFGGLFASLLESVKLIGEYASAIAAIGGAILVIDGLIRRYLPKVWAKYHGAKSDDALKED